MRLSPLEEEARLELKLRRMAPPLVLGLAYLAMRSAPGFFRTFFTMWVDELGWTIPQMTSRYLLLAAVTGWDSRSDGFWARERSQCATKCADRKNFTDPTARSGARLARSVQRSPAR